jgi:murein DD-endopeptidase MepM/ murein hydrolase activator NlpD
MSQLSASPSQQTARAQQAARVPARPVDVRRYGEGFMRQAAKLMGRSQFTIAHGGRQIRFGPVAFWIAVGSLVIMAGWSATTATYFAFRDDVLKNLLARQAAQQYAYEDRIAELRTQIDRTTSRQLLDREQFERKLDDLLHREATLESRASALSSLADPMATGSLRPAMRDSDLFAAPQRLNRGTMLEPGREPGASGETADIGETLDRVEASLDRVDRGQSATLVQMQERYDSQARKVRGVLASLGLKLDAPAAASGGPFVPIKLPPESQSFERSIMRVSIARAEADRLDSALATVPLRIPVSGEVDISSPFGVRIDPFLHVAAMHTGIDFRGEFGEPIHATANGTVTTAGWSGGYGKMVEIDHGNGLSTRYGHLSEIDVQIGQRIRMGQVIGRLGSTGRSTGPHLHYETRIDGEAVDPDKFLIAGTKLFGLPQEVRRAGHSEVQD